jgi:hypothetical protein
MNGGMKNNQSIKDSMFGWNILPRLNKNLSVKMI